MFRNGYIPRIDGSGGGGGKGGGSAPSPVEAPNSLQANTIARVIYLLGEGDIEGPAIANDWYKSAYINETPVTSTSNVLNFPGITILGRLGTPEQDHIQGFDFAETPFSVGNELTFDNPVTRRISSPEVDAVKVIIQLAGLSNLDQESGNLEGHNVTMEVYLTSDADNPASQPVRVIRDRIVGKTTRPYPVEYRVSLEGPPPYDIQVRRASEDDDEATIQSDTSWLSYIEVIESKLTYPDSVVVGVSTDASQYGSTNPVVAFRVFGRRIQIPSNMNGRTRIFTGEWDGTFKTEYCNDPAWVVWDIITHDRYGLGRVFESEDIDKWALYTISRYNSTLLDDGKGGLEPRFSFNGQITTRERATRVIDSVAGVMRSSILWTGTQMGFMQDAPRGETKIFSRANVIGGDFTYTGTSLTARHSVAHITWFNPDNFFKPEIMVVEDDESLERYGYNVITATAFGCTSSGQAYRHGLHALLTEKLETDAVSFKVGLADADMLPGEIIKISDPIFLSADMAGRTNANPEGFDNTHVFFDREVVSDDNTAYTLHCYKPDGELKEYIVTSLNTHSSGKTYATIELGDNDAPLVGSMWLLVSTTVKPRRFRVLAIKEDRANEFSVAAIEYSGDKYEAIDNGVFLPDDDGDFSNLPDPTQIDPPTNLLINYDTKDASGSQIGYIYVEWEAPQDDFIRGYIVRYRIGDNNWVTMPETPFLEAEISEVPLSVIGVTVRAVNTFGKFSDIVSDALDLTTGGVEDRDVISSLQLKGGAIEWVGKDIHLEWGYISPYSNSPRPVHKDAFFMRFNICVWEPETYETFLNLTLDEYDDLPEDSRPKPLLEYSRVDASVIVPYEDLSKHPIRRDYTIVVEVLDVHGKLSAPELLKVLNPPPELPSVVGTSGMGQVSLHYEPPIDRDFEGLIVWASDAPNFEITDETRVFKGTGTPVITAPANTPVYLRYAGYDSFGEDNIIISEEILLASLGISEEDLSTTLSDRLSEAAMLALSATNRIREVRDASLIEARISGQIQEVTASANNANANYEEGLSGYYSFAGDIPEELPNYCIVGRLKIETENNENTAYEQNQAQENIQGAVLLETMIEDLLNAEQ